MHKKNFDKASEIVSEIKKCESRMYKIEEMLKGDVIYIGGRVSSVLVGFSVIRDVHCKLLQELLKKEQNLLNHRISELRTQFETL